MKNNRKLSSWNVISIVILLLALLFVLVYEAYIQEVQPMVADIDIQIEGTRTTNESPYTLDLIIDDLGQYTESLSQLKERTR